MTGTATRWTGTSVAPQSIVDPYDKRADAETFDFTGYLSTLDARLMSTSEGRRALTYANPLAFAICYLRHHMTSDETGGITFADCHLDWIRLGRQLMRKDPGLRGWRHSFASPRNSGKSSWWYLLIPVWAAAHGHVRFIASFANGATQAEMHLQTFRTEAASNELLRLDYPELCTAVRKPTGRTVADNEGHYQSRSGFVWVARGIDNASLGMKVSDRRPDMIVLDDIEKDESQYSPNEVKKRLTTLLDAIFPLNERAFVVLVGTVTRPGSINHQLVKVATGEVDPATDEGATLAWIADERIRPHYYPPIVDLPDGRRRSIWPAKWSLKYLESIEHTRNYQKNFRNNPRAESGDYWSEDDIRYGTLPLATKWFLFVDPPVTVKTHSDPCGLAVLAYQPGSGRTGVQMARMLARLKAAEREPWMDTLSADEVAEAEAGGQLTRLSRVCVELAEEVRKTGTPLKQHIMGILERFPRIGAVVIEVNQGGDLWIEVMNDLPVKLLTFHSSEPKPVRIGWGLEYYQKRRVTHAKRFTVAEDQLTSYPRVEHDDVADVIATGLTRLLKPKKDRQNKSIRSV